jgi:hypothetical protein
MVDGLGASQNTRKSTVKPPIPAFSITSQHKGILEEQGLLPFLKTDYVLSTGCQWQALPKDLPPKSTAHSYFMLWDWDGTLERIHHALYVETREREGRAASPTAAIIDSQSAKAAQKGAPRLIRKVLMRARRSPGASATSLSIRSAFC